MHNIDVGYGVYDDFKSDQGKAGAPYGNQNARKKGISKSEFSKRIAKMKTIDGKILKGITEHAEDQMKSKDIYESSVINAITKGVVRKSKTVEYAFTYDYNAVRIAVHQDRIIHTVTYKGKENKINGKNSQNKQNNR